MVFKKLVFNHGRVEPLPSLLNRIESYVFIKDHCPAHAWAWWPATMPLSLNGVSKQIQVRRMIFDLQMPLEEFLGDLDAFKDCGLDLWQWYHPLPGSFFANSKEVGFEELASTGLVFARFIMPHQGEVSIYYTNDEKHFANLTSTPVILREACIEE